MKLSTIVKQLEDRLEHAQRNKLAPSYQQGIIDSLNDIRQACGKPKGSYKAKTFQTPDGRYGSNPPEIRE